MIVLGLGVFCDASAAIVRDGEILCAIEEERLNLDKHYEGFPWLSIEECLRIAGLRSQDIDAVAIGWNPYLGWGTRIAKSLRDSIRNPGAAQSKLLRGGNYIHGIRQIFRFRQTFFQKFSSNAPPVHYVPHHWAHAASAFLGSEFEKASIVVADGVGEADTFSIFEGDGTSLIRKYALKFPHSLGHLYASVTAFLGFRPTYDEGKVMALASFGDDTYRELFDEVCPVEFRGNRFRLRTDILDYHQARQGIFSRTWMERTELQPRKREEPLEQSHKDLAASLQACIERRVLGILHAHLPESNIPLCAAGGLFLNSVLNGRIVRERTREFFVQPAAGDNGVSLGAALYTAANHDDRYRRVPMTHAFLGTAYTKDDLLEAVNRSGFDYTQPEDVYDALANDIIAGNVVAHFNGAMEFGPRALGNRSILAMPSLPDMKDTLNRKVKHREAFRPFAAAVLLDDVHEYFEDAAASPYMLKVFYFKHRYMEVFPAICHVDGSCRLQTITQEQNPAIYALLIAMKEKTGHGIVLNTSLNVAGQPIIRTPGDALDILRKTDVDVLYLGPYVLARKNAGISRKMGVI